MSKFKIIIGLLVIGTVSVLIGAGFIYKAKQSARHAEDVRVLLLQYEWLKEMAADLKEDFSDIKNYQAEAEAIIESNHNLSPVQWSADDKKEYVRIMESLMRKLEDYNALSKEYNEQMDKLVGLLSTYSGLPPGASRPLPREFKLIPVE